MYIDLMKWSVPSFNTHIEYKKRLKWSRKEIFLTLKAVNFFKVQKSFEKERIKKVYKVCMRKRYKSQKVLSHFFFFHSFCI
jgi:hypothetical protein